MKAFLRLNERVILPASMRGFAESSPTRMLTGEFVKRSAGRACPSSCRRVAIDLKTIKQQRKNDNHPKVC